ncbi:MAG TPA: YihY/virulence factor BrkB family protein [Candidatus Thermoplasmatota archaeon]|nr:YihY/virulence factor BrkB family protein [Candidatus Thermoplasmatota archaeon]
MAALVPMVKETLRQWIGDKAPRLAAALSYYTVFALAPLLILVIALAGAVFGADAVRAAVMAQATDLVGPAAAGTIDEALANAQHAKGGWLATGIAAIGFALGATGVFGALQSALNSIWGIDVRRGGWRHVVKTRVLSFSLVVMVGFLLLVSLVVSAGWAAASAHLRGMLQGRWMLALGGAVDVAVTVGLFTAMLAAVYKVLPDAKVAWRDTWVGSLVTAVLLTLGKYAIGLYLGQSRVGTTFGAAGSLAAILVWLYYTGLILFLGAEYTQVHAEMNGRPLQPKAHAFAVQTVDREDVRKAPKPRGKAT